jgi:hypothetical protein
VFEHREELARREHRLLFLVQAHQDFRHGVGHPRADGADRLCEERERVGREHVAQLRDRVIPFFFGGHARFS